MSPFFTLAEDFTPEQRQQILFWGFIIMGIAIVGFVAIMIFRRRMMAAEEGEQHPGFSLAELRAMRDRGEITSEEYEQTKARVIAKVKANLNKPSKKKPSKGHS